jgi:hypothetical protein
VTIEDFEAFIANLEKQKLTKASSCASPSPMRCAAVGRATGDRRVACVGRCDARSSQNVESEARPALYALRALAIALSENSATRAAWWMQHCSSARD